MLRLSKLLPLGAAVASALALVPAHAGSITTATAAPNPSTEGTSVSFNVNGTGPKCWVRLVYGGGEPSDNVEITGVPLRNVVPKTFQKKGTYNVQVIGSPSQSPACTGQTQLTLVVNAKPQPPAVGPAVSMPAGGISLWDGNCPAQYEKVFENKPYGEVKCRKLPVPCPPHFDGSVDSNTGKLVCTPKPVTCPDGWEGAMQGGILSCNSKPQPTLPCPKATPTWQWGTTYYKEGWRFMGCVKNIEPPK